MYLDQSDKLCTGADHGTGRRCGRRARVPVTAGASTITVLMHLGHRRNLYDGVRMSGDVVIGCGPSALAGAAASGDDVGLGAADGWRGFLETPQQSKQQD